MAALLFYHKEFVHFRDDVDEYYNFKISVVISVSGTEILKPLEFPGE
jgi:hypothetical protein